MRILTDSTALLPTELVRRHGIVVVPLIVSWDGAEFRDGVDVTYADFASRASEVVARTAAPSPGEYMEAIERADGPALIVAPPAEMSATFHNAELAASGNPDVRVLDARSAAAGQGLIVLEAARASGGLEEIAERAAEVAKRVRLVATLDRLDYIRRSGRVPAPAAVAGDALHLHPLFAFVEGKPVPMGAARGGRRAADRLVADLESTRPRTADRLHASVMHSSRQEHAALLAERIDTDGAEVLVVELSAGVAAHLGPGALGIAWWWEPVQ